MKPRSLTAALLVLCLILPALSTDAAPRLAFGYLSNRSGDSNYDYLETIFPNSFAGAVQNIFSAKVMKPVQVNKKMAEYRLKLEKEYDPYELAALTDKLSADYFIYGSFALLPRDMIKVNLKLYRRSTNSLFAFSNTGKMEAEIFKLVDRTANTVIDFILNENFFTSSVVPKGSKIGILTNLDGEDLNFLYGMFLSKGYNVAGIQANELRNNFTADSVGFFTYFSAGENSYQMISDPRKMKFLHGTWTGERYYDEINCIKKMYRIYDLDYNETESDILEKLGARYNLDKLLIIGFNRGKRSAWVRCIDVRSKDLIWMQSAISGSLSEVCLKMIDRMSDGLNLKPK
jgi:hypothetical protein